MCNNLDIVLTNASQIFLISRKIIDAVLAERLNLNETIRFATSHDFESMENKVLLGRKFRRACTKLCESILILYIN